MIIVPRHCPSCGKRLRKGRVHPSDAPRLNCANCGFIHYDNPVPCAGVVVSDGARVLLGRRRNPPYRGMWNLLGGFIEGGEHPEVAARREVSEEAGIEVQLVRLLGIWMDRYGRTPERTLNLIYEGVIIGGTPRAGDDVAALRWFAHDALPLDRLAFENGREALLAWRSATTDLKMEYGEKGPPSA